MELNKAIETAAAEHEYAMMIATEIWNDRLTGEDPMICMMALLMAFNKIMEDLSKDNEKMQKRTDKIKQAIQTEFVKFQVELLVRGRGL